MYHNKFKISTLIEKKTIMIVKITVFFFSNMKDAFTIFRSRLEILLPSRCERIVKCQLRVLKLKNSNSYKNRLYINVLM